MLSIGPSGTNSENCIKIYKSPFKGMRLKILSAAASVFKSFKIEAEANCAADNISNAFPCFYIFVQISFHQIIISCRLWQVPYFWAGIKAYDLVAGRQTLKSSYILSKAKALELFPMLNRDKLKAALVYYDGKITVNSLWPSDAIWQHRSGSTLDQVMACCLTAPSHYLAQCWLIINEVLWNSPKGNLTGIALSIDIYPW